jgi:hypothetical protein
MSITPSTDHYWTDLLPPNGGFIHIKEENTGNRTVRGVSMFHQLHCLQMIRMAFQDLLGVGSEGMDMDKRHGKAKLGEGEGVTELHWTHCLDYLRQVSRHLRCCWGCTVEICADVGKNILCMADDTIESTHVSKTGKLLVDGYMEHQCRDARPVYRAAGGVMKDEDTL